jgi:DNA invertase Pin-like site-specific DNA recombinase
MPQRKERMAGYIRESDVTLVESVTIDSAAKAIREYGEKAGYIYEPQHEYKEAVSAYYVPYFDRTELMRMLKAAGRHEFDVLVVTEIRGLSRTGAGEVFTVYEMLRKNGIRLETISGKVFENTPMGQMILGYEATYAAMEREVSYLRMQRGMRDRVILSGAPPRGLSCYGYILVDTDREVKGRYEFNHVVIHTDSAGVAWSEYTVRKYILLQLEQGISSHTIARNLNVWGIPTPRARNGKACWEATTILRIAQATINYGEVYVNRYKKVGNKMVERPRGEWIRLPDAPAIIDKETYERIQMNISHNRQDSVRNNRHREELGLLRSGYCRCGICGRVMIVKYSSGRNNNYPIYVCHQRDGVETRHKHYTQIALAKLDAITRRKIVEALLHPETVREKVEAYRSQKRPPIDTQAIEATIEEIRVKMRRIYKLAENATDDETMADLTVRMNELEAEKRQAESLLYAAEDIEEKRQEIEQEIVKFERWVEQVRPTLTDMTLTPTYEELRFAIRILGLKCTVFPNVGDYPFRYDFEATVPEVMKKVELSFNQGFD